MSNYLKSKHDLAKRLVNDLLKSYPYVSILGKQVEGKDIVLTSFDSRIQDSFETQCGFVVKVYNGTSYSEYSFSDFNEKGLEELEKKIKESVSLSSSLMKDQIKVPMMEDPEMVKEFIRKDDGKAYSQDEIIAKLNQLKEKIHATSKEVIQAMIRFEHHVTYSLFISKHRDLYQEYPWNYLMTAAVARRGDNTKFDFKANGSYQVEATLAKGEAMAKDVAETATMLLDAKPIEPGYYDIICAPDVTGLIVHEAFGHGVEMDMFVKKRARSRKYLNKRVASPLVEMHDGAAAADNVASYFFDDDGVLAHDTLIIKDGILQTGISDSLSALELSSIPTGNSRRQDPSRKAYTRMTNTYFSKGKDKLEDMIKSIKHGYMLFESNNGMEDPKNWNIQCVAGYGKEIVDGKFTGKIVAPVVMSGDVLDLLNSISMVSGDFALGAGHCGKGYKEWVPVSDGGPAIKAKCKLG